MGVLIEKSSDTDLFEKAVNETFSIVQSSESILLVKSKRPNIHEVNSLKINQNEGKVILRGFCIRCEARIAYDPKKPYCKDCFNVWVQYGNPDYQENVCHRCGEYEGATMGRPQCYTCYSERQ